MSSEFLIGNGLLFEKKDVLQAVRSLDFEYQKEIVDEIFRELVDKIKVGTTAGADKSTRMAGVEAFDALKTIHENTGLYYSLVLDI
jgi:hypothetical protein